MDHMSKFAILLGVCLSLSACVVYAPTYISDTTNTVVHYESTSQSYTTQKQETKEVSERVTLKAAQPRDQRSLADCGAFILPREAQKPRYLTDRDFALAKHPDQFDKMVAGHLKELQTHIDKLHSEYEQAHRRWMETCAKKLLH